LSVLIICHLGVAASVCGLAIAVGPGSLGISAMLAGGLAPLAVSYRGLRAGSRYTQQWLAISMVFYAGVGLAETVASLGTTLAATALTLTSAAELALLLRALKRPSTAHHESAES
jgi:uncharacterized membrane protein